MLELYRQLYDEQWARQDALQNVASVSMGLAALLGSAIVFVLPRVSWSTTLLNLAQLLPLLLAALCFVGAAYFIYVSIHNVEYRLAPDAAQVRKLEDWHSAADPAPSRETVAILVGDDLAHAYAEAASANRATNIQRGKRLFRANLIVAIGLVSSLVAAALVVPPIAPEKPQAATPVILAAPVEVHDARSNQRAIRDTVEACRGAENKAGAQARPGC